MSEYVFRYASGYGCDMSDLMDGGRVTVGDYFASNATDHYGTLHEGIVRCRDCKYLDDSEYSRWDSSLAECYGEPPLFCDLLSFNEWRMDGDRRVAETTFAEVEFDCFCKWGERRDA